MNKRYLFLVSLLLAAAGARAQGVGIGTGSTAPAASAMLEVASTSKGILVPRMTQTQRIGISSPAPGLMVYQTDAPTGFWYYEATAGWTRVGPATSAGNGLTQSGTSVALGGTLTQNTSIAQAGFNLGLTGGNFGVGTATPRGKLDIDGGGDSYLVDDPSSGSTQSVYLPGHLYLAPYSGTSGTAYVQARVPSPSASTSIGLTLRTSNGTQLVDALQLSAAGAAKLPALGGTGTRMVTADATGNLSTQAIPGAVTTATAAAPTAATNLAPTVSQQVYTDNGSFNGVVTLTTGADGQQVTIVNRDAQYLSIVANGSTGNILPGFAANYVYSSSDAQWHRQN